jgi:hypothetical protein
MEAANSALLSGRSCAADSILDYHALAGLGIFFQFIPDLATDRISKLIKQGGVLTQFPVMGLA